MRNTNRKKQKSKLKNVLLNHIYQNLKLYIVVTIVFLIGIIAGVIFINYAAESQITEIGEYLNQFITALKGDYQIDKGELLKNALLENLKLTIAMWFIGSTVIGMPIVFGIVLYRGFCIGYTVSSAIVVLGMQKGIVFFLTTILLQNIVFIPVLIALAVSGMKLYQSIMKDKRKENIKIEIVRHTMVSIILFAVLMGASFIETYVSSNLLESSINFF